MSELGHKLVSAAASALLGVLVGWAGSALTLGGRVSAIEAGFSRIEQRLDAIWKQEKAK